MPWLPPVLWYLVIAWFSHRSQAQLPGGIPDILPHFAEYLLLGFLVLRAAAPSSRRGAVLVFLVLVFLALGDELHQYFVPTRMCSAKDLLVDALGAAAGMALAVWRRRRNKKVGKLES